MTTSHPSVHEEILRLFQEESMTRFPAFPEVFGRLRPVSRPAMEAPLGTDGVHLFYDPQQLTDWFLNFPKRLRRAYLQTHLHCLCLHVIRRPGIREDCWDMACDLWAAHLAARLLAEPEDRAFLRKLREIPELSPDSRKTKQTRLSPGGAPFPESNQKTAGSIPPESAQTHPLVSLARRLEDSLPLQELAASCALDTHRFWIEAPSSCFEPSGGSPEGSFPDPEAFSGLSCESGNPPEDFPGSQKATSVSRSHLDFQALGRLEAVAKLWGGAAISQEGYGGMGQRGESFGSLVTEAALQERDSIDYHRFLKRFAVPREEAILDDGSFDYIPYYYGFVHYGNLPFLEPLEYREVNRLDELAIAIDTSGSCSGRIVRRFLEETWSILRQRENFFSRMRLHLFQCDSMIQDYRLFTSREEWEAALPDLKIQGFGNTDFRPVFERLDRMIASKEIRSLRGLLYFTDGDGIFPQKAPSYETAFVFLNDSTEKHGLPGWAIRLNLHLPEDF